MQIKKQPANSRQRRLIVEKIFNASESQCIEGFDEVKERSSRTQTIRPEVIEPSFDMQDGVTKGAGGCTTILVIYW